jgi:hypothetical protein
VIARAAGLRQDVPTRAVIVVGIDGEFGAILDTLAHELAARPRHVDWTDLTLFLSLALEG